VVEEVSVNNHSVASDDQRVRVIFLVGFMGSGKTSVGRILSHRLNWRFEDLDDRIQEREGRSIAQIFRESGEEGFRKAEHAALRDLVQELNSTHVVIALGGGAVVQPENHVLVNTPGGRTVFLDAGLEELWRRCQDSVERPLRGDEQHFRHLYERRLPHYRKASVRVDTGGKDVESIAKEIVATLGLRGRRRA
jgi:shikimate kinase